jgi:hypothetical protein
MSRLSPAQFYQLDYGAIACAVDSNFLDKAAAFQEIRNCLIAADEKQISALEAERRIRFFVKTYLATN